MRRMFAALAAATALACGCGPVPAHEVAGFDVSDEADRLMWCAAAYSFLYGSAKQDGNLEKGQRYGNRFVLASDRGQTLLGDSGLGNADIDVVIDAYHDEFAQAVEGDILFRFEGRECDAVTEP